MGDLKGEGEPWDRIVSLGPDIIRKQSCVCVCWWWWVGGVKAEGEKVWGRIKPS